MKRAASIGCLGMAFWRGAAQGPVVELEMYGVATSSDDTLHPENVNLYDSAGLINYLLTSIVPETGKDAARATRDRGIDTVVKYTLKVRNPAAAVIPQGEFGRFARFDYGETADTTALVQYAQFGDFVGVQSFKPTSDPRFPFDSGYYAFSLNGPCPNLPNGMKQQATCAKYDQKLVPPGTQVIQGGLCSKANATEDPDGVPGCVYSVTEVQTYRLDKLAGIDKEDCGGHPCSNWLEFRQSCSNGTLRFTSPQGKTYCREYDYPGCIDSCTPSKSPACDPTQEVGLRFWRDRCNAERNRERVAALEAAFNGSKTEDFYATNPPCDQYAPTCNKPIPEHGVAYCHRSPSGVCDQCLVPGTVSPTRYPGQVNCRVDNFMGELKQYQNQLPACKNSCGSGPCTDATDEDLCCVYLAKCKPTWNATAWSECSNPCGKGTQTRQVFCPYEDLVGSCDPGARPPTEAECRGTKCPWNPTEFGDWSACGNACGSGAQQRSLICNCADDCPGGADECKDSPKPEAPARSCFKPGGLLVPEFCGHCNTSAGPCDTCLDNFTLSADGATCVATSRSVEIIYRLTAQTSLQESDFVGAFVSSFSFIMKQALGIPAQVSSFERDIMAPATVSTGTSFRRMQAGEAARLVAVVVCKQDTDAELRRVVRGLATISADTLLTQVLQQMPAHGCTGDCVLPQNLTMQAAQVPTPVCPDAAEWDEQAGCKVATTTTTTTTGPPKSGGSLPMGLIVGVAAVVLVLVLGAGAYFYFRGKPQQRQQQSQRRQVNRRSPLRVQLS